MGPEPSGLKPRASAEQYNNLAGLAVAEHVAGALVEHVPVDGSACQQRHPVGDSLLRQPHIGAHDPGLLDLVDQLPIGDQAPLALQGVIGNVHNQRRP